MNWFALARFPACRWASGTTPRGAKYRHGVLRAYPGVWRHGDWARLTRHDGLVILGRSDATLNPGGVRIGTAEIYRQVEQLPEVVESLVVGQDWEGDVRIVLFVRLREGATLTRSWRAGSSAGSGSMPAPTMSPERSCRWRTSPGPSAGRSPSSRSGTSSTAARLPIWTHWPIPQALDVFRDLGAAYLRYLRVHPGSGDFCDLDPIGIGKVGVHSRHAARIARCFPR